MYVLYMNSSPWYFVLSVIHLHYPSEVKMMLTPMNISQLPYLPADRPHPKLSMVFMGKKKL